jgi:ferredoxin
MNIQNENPFEQFLSQKDEEAWSATLATLLRSIHEVDRNATQIWFAFYPLSLWQALEQADDRERLVQQLLLQGDYDLKDQIDRSHAFLYGHRFWPQVKKAVEQHAEEWDSARVGGRVLGVEETSNQSVAKNSLTTAPSKFSSQHPTPKTLYPTASLSDQILSLARRVAAELKKEESLLVGITAVAFMTLQQTGLAAFKAAPGAIHIDRKHANKSPERILRDRAKDDSQGLLGFLRTVNKQFTITHDENDDKAKYKLNDGQDLAWGAAEDRSRDWIAIDPRRSEGPIPVECRSASCGTCWVGVLGGAEKLADVAAREGKKIKEFGYIDTAEPKPLIRLACQAQAGGAISVVIPPWNGQFGKYLKALKHTGAESPAVRPANDRAQQNDAVN